MKTCYFPGSYASVGLSKLGNTLLTHVPATDPELDMSIEAGIPIFRTAGDPSFFRQILDPSDLSALTARRGLAPFLVPNSILPFIPSKVRDGANQLAALINNPTDQFVLATSHWSISLYPETSTYYYFGGPAAIITPMTPVFLKAGLYFILSFSESATPFTVSGAYPSMSIPNLIFGVTNPAITFEPGTAFPNGFLAPPVALSYGGGRPQGYVFTPGTLTGTNQAFSNPIATKILASYQFALRIRDDGAGVLTYDVGYISDFGSSITWVANLAQPPRFMPGYAAPIPLASADLMVKGYAVPSGSAIPMTPLDVVMASPASRYLTTSNWNSIPIGTVLTMAGDGLTLSSRSACGLIPLPQSDFLHVMDEWDSLSVSKGWSAINSTTGGDISSPGSLIIP